MNEPLFAKGPEVFRHEAVVDDVSIGRGVDKFLLDEHAQRGLHPLLVVFAGLHAPWFPIRGRRSIQDPRNRPAQMDCFSSCARIMPQSFL